MNWLRKHFDRRDIAFLMIVAAGFLAIHFVQAHDNQKLRQLERSDNQKVAAALVVADNKITAAQLDACGRGNVLRASVNAETRIVRYFMQLIQHAAASKKDPASQERAGLYKILAAGLQNAPIVDCKNVIG